MTKRLLIDGSFQGESRVALLDEDRLTDYDVEWAESRPHRSNIYLAKVVRVEPSLQSAFVEYGGNRHGFLPFSEIHPDYYRIPVSDRENILAEEAREEEEADNALGALGNDIEDAATQKNDEDSDIDTENEAENGVENSGELPPNGEANSENGKRAPSAERTLEVAREARSRRRALRRYHIQEVIPTNQVLLTQVIKDEHRNKGATLTTYISLAGRYCVLMPNSNRGGGVSRKVTDSATREKLHSLLDDLEIPEGMAVILRTAGSERNSREIRRDFESLLTQWETIRDRTLDSNAPAQIYDDGSLIQRAIRDIYTSDIDEVLVAGEEAWRQASESMKILVPSHARRVKLWKNEKTSLFAQYRVEQTLGNLQNPRVRLRSGGEIVISQTEALVAVDVNSGRATRERNIERTAFKTNLEAAEESARQLRIRDLSGLIVIDFIDMESSSHIREVERTLKDALRNDRARVQVGHISQFGLLELSRQRLRISLSDSTTIACDSCLGSGRTLAPSMATSQALRGLLDRIQHRPDREYVLKVSPAVANFLLNRRRTLLIDLEKRYETSIEVLSDAALTNGDSVVEHVVTRNNAGRYRQNSFAERSASADVSEGQAETRDILEDENRTPSPRGSRRRGRRGGTGRRRDETQRDETQRDETQRDEAQHSDSAQATRNDDDAHVKDSVKDRDTGDTEVKAEVEGTPEKTPSRRARKITARKTTARKSPAKSATAKTATKAKTKTKTKSVSKEAAEPAEESAPALKPSTSRSSSSKSPSSRSSSSKSSSSKPSAITARPKRRIVRKTTKASKTDDVKSEGESNGPKRRGWWQRT